MNFKASIPLTFAAGILLAATQSFAQDERDALRYSFLSPQGTARSIGFGSALGSVGADFSSLSVNPAGIGLYRRGELTLTPSLRFNGANSDYQNTETKDNVTRFNVSNLGIVLTNAAKGKRYDRSAWKTFSFGFGLNRVADFNNRYTYGGYNTTSSGSEMFAIEANSGSNFPDIPVNSLGDLGYQAYLIDTFNNRYYTNVDYEKGINQLRTVEEKGGINEMAFSVGGNYNEKLMVGVTLGVPILRYYRAASYGETDANDSIPYFTNYRLSETLTTRGSGLNLKLGVIYKPVDQFRLGLSIHTPTWYRLTDDQQVNITSTTENYGGYTEFSPDPNTFEYSLTTPWRGVASATAFLGKIGFVSVDYEYVNYRSMRYRFETTYNRYNYGSGTFAEYEQTTNDAIKSTYQAASNIRAGVEIRLESLFLRGGFGYYGSPYKNSDNFKPVRTDFSAGIGYRQGAGFVDLGFVHSRYDRQESPYVLNYGGAIGTIAPVATLSNSLNNVALTVGVKF